MDVSPKDETPLEFAKLFELPDMPETHWEPFREGIDIHRMYGGDDQPTGALLRYSAGASLPRHIHRGYEHILVLRGSQIDDSGEHVAGSLLVYKPGSSHAIRSPLGCVVFIIWELPVYFVPTAEAT